MQVFIIEQSTISTEGQCISPLPATATRATNHLVVAVALTHTTVFTASSGQTTQLTVLVHWFADPVDSWITAYSFVEWVYHDDFKVFVCRIFGHPVRVKHSQAAAVSASTLLGKNGTSTFTITSDNKKINLTLSKPMQFDGIGNGLNT